MLTGTPSKRLSKSFDSGPAAGYRRDVIRRTPELLAKARRLYEAGASTREVGRALGFSFATARTLLLAAGVALRRPGRRRMAA